MTTHGKPLSRRGIAYRAEALLGLPKTEPAIRDGRRVTLYHGRWPSLMAKLQYEAEALSVIVDGRAGPSHGMDREDRPWISHLSEGDRPRS